MDDTLYLRGKRQERGDYKAKFMTDGFDRWAETSAPARVGRVEKEPSDVVNTTMSGDALRRHMRKHHMEGGMYGEIDGDGFLSGLASAASSAAKGIGSTVSHVVRTGQKYVKKAADFYKKNEKVIKETASAIKEVADATGLTGLALEQGVKLAQKAGLMPKPPPAVEEAAFDEAEAEIEEEIEGGMRPACSMHMTGGSAKQIRAALARFRPRRGDGYRPPIVGYTMPDGVDMGMQGGRQRGTVGRARLSTRSPTGDALFSPEAKQKFKERFPRLAARLGAPPRAVGGRAPSARAAIVKQVMAERGVSLPQASRIVKEEGLY